MAHPIKTFFQSFGIDIATRPKYGGKARFSIDGHSYGFCTPNANYTPWDGDAEFQSIYAKIKSNTLVDIYRCFELWQLAEKAAELAPAAAILEVGVWRGGTAAVISRKLKNMGASITLYLADTFSGVVNASESDTFYKGGEHSDTSRTIAENIITATSDYSGVQILQGIFPEDTAGLVPQETKFSLCHIDVDVYDSARNIVDWIWNKLVPGGMIVFDDYGFHSCVGIAKYVESLRHRPDLILLHNLNGHAVIIKI